MAAEMDAGTGFDLGAYIKPLVGAALIIIIIVLAVTIWRARSQKSEEIVFEPIEQVQETATPTPIGGFSPESTVELEIGDGEVAAEQTVSEEVSELPATGFPAVAIGVVSVLLAGIGLRLRRISKSQS